MTDRPLIELWVSGIPRTQGSGDRMRLAGNCPRCHCRIEGMKLGPYVDNSEKQLKNKDGVVTRRSGALSGWKSNVATSAKLVMFEEEHELIEGAPVQLVLQFVIERKKSVTRKHPHTVGADVSKLTRAVEDALEGIAYANDSQIIAESVSKRYAEDGEPTGVRIAWQEVE